jgi:murein DD-endopeptidase MepM/ murein hydrolase activator NlpD
MKLQLTYPLDEPILASQGFGANPQMYADPKYGGIKGHNGIDFFAGHGNPVYASHDGTAYYEYDSGQGEGIVLRTDKTYDYNGEQVYFKTIYWHLCNAKKEPQFTSPIYTKVGYQPDQTGVSQIGWKVRTGELIGYADNTGASTGDHLHFGLKPQAQNESNGAWLNIEQNNGYLGAIDPAPYFDGSTPKKIHLLEKMVEALKMLVDLLKKKLGLS